MTNRSTGPRSAEGKARSSKNALKSGIYSQSQIIPGEDPRDHEKLVEEYHHRFLPSTPEQRDLVDLLIHCAWTLRRLSKAQAQTLAWHMENTTMPSPSASLGEALARCDQTLVRLQRIIDRNQRNYQDALHELERLQKLEAELVPEVEPRAAEPPQPAQTEALPVRDQFVSSDDFAGPEAVAEAHSLSPVPTVPSEFPAPSPGDQPYIPLECAK